MSLKKASILFFLVASCRLGYVADGRPQLADGQLARRKSVSEGDNPVDDEQSVGGDSERIVFADEDKNRVAEKEDFGQSIVGPDYTEDYEDFGNDFGQETPVGASNGSPVSNRSSTVGVSSCRNCGRPNRRRRVCLKWKYRRAIYAWVCTRVGFQR